MIGGITGHQELGTLDDIAWVRRSIELQVAKKFITRGVSCLAGGADQIFVETLLKMSIAYDVIIPCEGYEEAFSGKKDLQNFRLQRIKAGRVWTLPFSSPSEEAFLAGGSCVVDQCGLLFAVWDGRPANGLGGTGDVVMIARALRKPVLHINPERRTIRMT